MTTPRESLTNYLTSTGWVPPVETGPAGGLWMHPDSDLLLPVPHEFIQGGLDWQLIVDRLAQVEGAEPSDVLARLDGRLVDVANIRAANDIVIRDTIPYSAGVTMVRESWTMLRAAATTSIGQRSHIRHYRRSADTIIESARMAHTRRGSFIIPIYLPLPELETDPDSLPTQELQTAVSESRERRIMRTFAEALAAIKEIAVVPEKELSANGVQDLVRAGVSHEFAASLKRVLAEEAIAEFSATFVWAPGGGPPPRTPSEVSIPAAAAERLKRVSEKLKTAAVPHQTEYLTGPIVGVHRDDEDQSGVVTVQVSRNARLAHVSVNVSREHLDEALDWMKARETVVVQSRVHRSSSGLFADTADAVTPLTSHQLGET